MPLCKQHTGCIRFYCLYMRIKGRYCIGLLIPDTNSLTFRSAKPIYLLSCLVEITFLLLIYFDAVTAIHPYKVVLGFLGDSLYYYSCLTRNINPLRTTIYHSTTPMILHCHITHICTYRLKHLPVNPSYTSHAKSS